VRCLLAADALERLGHGLAGVGEQRIVGAGNASPVVGAPWLTAAVRPERPCEGVFRLPAVWQPLQVLVSPGITCIQLVCCALMRRPFTSRTSMTKGTSAGTWICTEPSG